MSLVVADRVKETTLTVGQGPLTLLGPTSGFRAFSSVMSSGDTCYYAIQSRAPGQWEVGLATLSGAGLERTTVLASSSSGALVLFASGPKDVFLTAPARNVLAGTATPAALAASQNDYAVGDANVLRLASSVDVDITGLAAGTPGRVLVVQNIGGFTITLVAGSVLSAAANRFDMPADLPVLANTSVMLFYDAGWRPLSGAGGGTFTNAVPCTVSVGGISAGSTFDNQSLSDLFNAMLYPYQAPSFSAFGISGQSTPIEVGATVSASVTFTWSTTQSGNVAPNTVGIADLTRSETVATGLANSGSHAATLSSPVTKTTATSHSFRVSATNTQSGGFSRDYTVSWQWRKFHGTNVSPTLTSGDIAALVSSGLSSGYAGTYNFAAGGYKFICFAHAAGGQINRVTYAGFDVAMVTNDGDPGNATYSNIDGGGFHYALVSFTNANGVTTNYRVYRSLYILGGATDFTVT